MKKRVIAVMLIIAMMSGMVTGCGKSVGEKESQIEATEQVASTEESTENVKPQHQVGDTFTENIAGVEVPFLMMDFDRAGVEMPVPSALIDATRFRGGVASEDDWNNYIICEPSDSVYQYHDANGFFLYVAGYDEGDPNCVYTNEDGSSNITDSVTLSDAQVKWGKSNDAFRLTTEPVITNHDNGTLAVSFDTSLTKTATINNIQQQHTWQGEYYALKNGKHQVNLIFGNSSYDNATVKAIGDYMVDEMRFKDKTIVAAGNEDTKTDLNAMHANGTDVTLSYVDVDGMTLLNDNLYFTFDYGNDLMQSDTKSLFRNDRAFIYTATGLSGISKEALATITDMNSCASIMGQLGFYNYSGENFAMSQQGDFTYMTFEGVFSVDGIDYQSRYTIMTNTVSTYVLVIGCKPDGGDLAGLRNTIADSCRIKNPQ